MTEKTVTIAGRDAAWATSRARMQSWDAAWEWQLAHTLDIIAGGVK